MEIRLRRGCLAGEGAIRRGGLDEGFWYGPKIRGEKTIGKESVYRFWAASRQEASHARPQARSAGSQQGAKTQGAIRQTALISNLLILDIRQRFCNCRYNDRLCLPTKFK